MSDTTVTTVPPVAPQPAQQQVPINPNPTNSPNAIGNQAPDKSPAESRRDSIKAAFDRANNPQRAKEAKPQAKPADAKPGHNQPPEETKAERSLPERNRGEKNDRPERIDLRKRPDAQSRSERGQFSPRDNSANNSANLANSGQPLAKQGQALDNRANPLPPTAPYRDAPPRMSERAKGEWHAAPESVRGEVHRMSTEFLKAYNTFKADHETMKTIRPFAKMAADHGTTLEKALTNYTGMEVKLRQDPVAALDTIVNNLNLRTPNGEKLGLRDIAYHVLSQSPEQMKILQQGNVQQAAVQQIGALHQQIAHLQNSVQQMHTEKQFTNTRSAVDQFALDNPRFDELGDLIEKELKLGFDLPTAYHRASLLRPGNNAAPQAAQTRTQSPPAQTRQPDRSIYGAPSAGPSNGTSRPKQSSGSARDAVKNAIRRVNGAI